MSSEVGPLVAVGRTSDVYEYGRGSVIKVSRPAVPAHWAAMEAQFTAAVRELGSWVPEVRAVVEVDGRDAIVFERVDGRSMWDRMVARPGDARALGVELAQVHWSILCAGLPTNVAGHVDRISRKIAEVQQLSAEERSAAQAAVAQLPRGAALLHGDLHPGNVLMAKRGPVVIDWFDAAVGHPVADVVRSSLLLRPLAVHAERPHLPGAPSGLLREVHDAYVSTMGDVITAPGTQLEGWESVIAASRLAEDAESDESSLLSLWRRDGRLQSNSLLAALSDGGSHESS